MTTDTDASNGANGDKQRMASAIWLGIFLIGLGVLLFTGWWWPGIMVVLGLAGCAALVFRGQTAKGIGTLALFWGTQLQRQAGRGARGQLGVVGLQALGRAGFEGKCMAVTWQHVNKR